MVIPASVHCKLPPAAQLLVQGGDARIALDAEGKNKYGCPPVPDTTLLALGSSTASCISGAGFAAADSLRNRLVQLAESEPDAVIYARELERMRREFIRLCGVSDMHGLEVVFSASGTDLHLIAAQLVSAEEPGPLLAIMVDAAETGSGVPAALSGHRCRRGAARGEASGVEVMQEEGAGEDSDSGNAIEVVTVAIRQADGMPRPPAEVDAEFEAWVNRAAPAGKRVLLVLTDVSKTGMIAPSPACARALQKKFPHVVEVLVDACQFRIAPSTLRSYLARDFMVALTGSKFVTGPPFSGALLIPEQAAQHLRKQPLPRALSAFSARADWPQNWPAAGLLDDVANFGLLLRWEAALEELRALRALPEAVVTNFLQEFARAISRRLADDPVFEPLPVSALERFPLHGAKNWDATQTIFPFLLMYPQADGSKLPLSREQTAQIYRLLQIDLSDRAEMDMSPVLAALRCQLGQPVACGSRAGVPVNALRLCASARMVVEASAEGGRNVSAIIERALAALDKTALLILSVCNPNSKQK
jgi:hypothetical protein